MSNNLVKRLRSFDCITMDGCGRELRHEAADRIEELEAKLDLSEGALDVASRSWSECQRILEQTEAKLAKCQALMHAGLAEYQRRLVGVIEASIAVRSAQKTYFKDRSKDNLIASKQAETSLDKLLVDLEGEIDD